uniref:Rhodei-litorin n=1 Tax=Pithecopus rohdei TaxID=8394 RepID=LITR_PITRO|nr:RecName: Full=Rhodei-litorin [Pithecopus rohdei]
QLWATGHFM